MKRSDIKYNFDKYTILSSNDFKLIDNNFDSRRLYERQKKWYISQIKKWFYIIKKDIIWDIELFMIANKIYTPSYISLESALSYYNLIPEWVSTITSITTRTTRSYNNKIGTFKFFHIKKELLTWYITKQYKQYKYNIATIEKAIFDFLYLNHKYNDIEDFKWLRINTNILKTTRISQRIISYWDLSWNKRCQQRIKNFISYVNNND